MTVTSREKHTLKMPQTENSKQLSIKNCQLEHQSHSYLINDNFSMHSTEWCTENSTSASLTPYDENRKTVIWDRTKESNYIYFFSWLMSQNYNETQITSENATHLELTSLDNLAMKWSIWLTSINATDIWAISSTFSPYHNHLSTSECS